MKLLTGLASKAGHFLTSKSHKSIEKHKKVEKAQKKVKNLGKKPEVLEKVQEKYKKSSGLNFSQVGNAFVALSFSASKKYKKVQ